MKSFFLTFTSFFLALAAIGHEGPGHGSSYQVSVFSGFHKIKSAESVNTQQTVTALQQQFPGWSARIDQLNGTFRDVFGTGIALPGATATEKAAYCFGNRLHSLGVVAAEWKPVRNTEVDHATYIDFRQELDGRPVVFSRLGFRFAPDGRLVRIRMKDYGKPVAGLVPAITAEAARTYALQHTENATITTTTVDETWVWFPVPSAAGYELRPAWHFTATGMDKQMPLELYGYVDAVTGRLLYRSNLVKDNVDKTVVGTVHTASPLLPATVEPLPHLLIGVNNTSYYTDANGFFEESTLSLPLNTNVLLRGKWAYVRAENAGSVVPSFPNVITTNGTTYEFPQTAPSSLRHVNAYYHVNKVHDFMKGHIPSFTGMDSPLRTNVDVAGSCNAYYTGASGGSINFFQSSGSCNSFALCSDIIYHEYGHAIAHRFYSWQGVGSMENGALNEGQADIWGLSITENPILGLGAFSNGGVIRRYDQAPKVYPVDIIGEVHNDGEIIAGAWWDLALNIGSVDTMTQLFVKTYFDLPDGPNGTEGEVYYDILVSALLNDDDDADFSNGTPHFEEIVSAFARHGIYLLGDAVFSHTDIAIQPATTPIHITTDLAVSTPAFLGDVRIFYRERAAIDWDSLVMTHTGVGNTYAATLPGFPEGSVLDYYFAVYDNSPNVKANAYAPQGYVPGIPIAMQHTVNIPYQVGVGLGSRYTENFETTLSPGWQIGLSTDNATGGAWIHASPVGSFAGGIPVQPGYDNTTGTSAGQCLVTGNAPSVNSASGTADVDNGITTVVTPALDLRGFDQPVIAYYRWFSNDLGSNPRNDLWEVQIRDSVSIIWRFVERTLQSDNSWRRRIFKVSEYFTSSVPDKVVMRFVASDKVVSGQPSNGQSLVEAALDDFFIYDNISSLHTADVPEPVRVLIYPNPANSEIRIRIKSGVTTGFIALYDIAGKEITRVAISAGREDYAIPTAHIAAGLYQVLMQTGSFVQLQKVTIAH